MYYHGLSLSKIDYSGTIHVHDNLALSLAVSCDISLETIGFLEYTLALFMQIFAILMMLVLRISNKTTEKNI